MSALAEIADQDHIAVDFALRQKQLLAVSRPIKIEDESGGEVGYLPARPACDGLFPEIGEAEVEDLCMAAGGDENISGLDVAMNDALRVGHV